MQTPLPFFSVTCIFNDLILTHTYIKMRGSHAADVSLHVNNQMNIKHTRIYW